jgi:DnaJ-class molecular chaperone
MSPYKLYADLGLKKSASDQDIKKQYRNLARQHHPDKGGDSERFKTVSHAYEILSDSTKKKKYDMMGGVEDQTGGGGGGNYSGFPFGGFSPFGPGMFKRQEQSEIIKPSIHRINISLDEIYKGVKKTIQVHHTVLCGSCTGSGMIGKVNNQTCSTCQGSGQQTHMRSLGPGMMQQVSQKCSKCQGSGRFVHENDKCRACSGHGFIKTKSRLEITVPPGADEKTILLKDDKKGGHVRSRQTNKLHVRPLLVMLTCTRHKIFQRCEEHLIMILKISIWEALCGIDQVITVLNEKIVRIQTPKNVVCSPGMYIMCVNEGLPWSTNNTQNGTLFIRLDIQFPNTITDQQRHTLTMLKGNIDVDINTEPMIGKLVDTKHVTRILEAVKERQEQKDQSKSSGHQQTRGPPECTTQ